MVLNRYENNSIVCTNFACVYVIDELFERLALKLRQSDGNRGTRRGRRHRTTGYTTYLASLHRLKTFASGTISEFSNYERHGSYNFAY